jgi:hypothetical protein
MHKISESWKQHAKIGDEVGVSFNYSRYRRYEVATIINVVRNFGGKVIDIEIEPFPDYVKAQCKLIPLTDKIINIVKAQDQIEKSNLSYRIERNKLLARQKQIIDRAEAKVKAIDIELDKMWDEHSTKIAKIEEIVFEY